MKPKIDYFSKFLASSLKIFLTILVLRFYFQVSNFGFARSEMFSHLREEILLLAASSEIIIWVIDTQQLTLAQSRQNDIVVLFLIISIFLINAYFIFI